MKIGDICPMSTATIRLGRNQYGMKAPNRGDRLVFLYVGLQQKDAPEIDIESQLRKLGWVPASDATGDGVVGD